MKKLFLLIIVSIIILLPDSATGESYGIYEYGISSYNVNIKISSDNVYEVTETIVADFYVPKHGIFRNIPTRYDGQKVKITDIYVSEQFTQSKSGGELILKIGDPNAVLNGQQEYIIKYKFNMGRDKNEGYDLFYFNIIGDGWDTTIENVRFNIEFPGFFEKSDVSFYTGSYGSTNTGNVYHEVAGLRITGSVPRLNPNEGLTANVVLPESTFAGESDNNNSMFYSAAAWVLCGLLILFAWYIWNTKGRDPLLYPSVQFSPPDGMSPAEVGYVIDGVVDNRDITSLIFYWADKGYLDISESGKNEFLFIKLKEPETTNAFETFMFHKLFEYGKDNWVSTNDLKQEFYEDIPIIKTQIKEKFEGDKKLFTRESTVWSGILYVLSGIPALLMLVSVIEGLPSFDALIPAVVMFIGTLVSGAVIIQTLKKWNIFTRFGKISRSVLFVMFIVIFFAVCFVFAFALEDGFSAIYHSKGYIATEAFRTSLATFAMFIFSAATIKRTEYGHSRLEYLLGLKNFINEAEMDKLRQMIDDNPEYFYNILPYAIVLGVEKKWAGKMDGIVVPPPDYYKTASGMPVSSGFATVSILRCISRTGFVMSVGKSSGSGGSGGGFSGGGAGGGGGGSW